jgi:hypothetical protein
MSAAEGFKITVTKNGPYLVEGAAMHLASPTL